MTVQVAAPAAAPQSPAERKPRLIPIAQIKKVRPDPKVRTFSKKTAQEIADSIQAVGLQYPITVRPLAAPEYVSTKDGEKVEVLYEPVMGTHRLYACGSILRWVEIPAHVMKLDDDDAEIMSMIENVARSELTQEQLFSQIARWRKLHGNKARLAAKAKDEAVQAAEKEGPEKVKEVKAAAREAARSNGEPARLSEKIARATGVSEPTAKRQIRASKVLEKLTEEQRAVVFPADADKAPRKQDLTALGSLSEKGVSEAITLAASGMAWDQAIKKSEARKPSNTKVQDPTKPKPLEDMSDQEYLDATCGKRLAMLKTKHPRDVYKSEAILYRNWVLLRKRIGRDVEALLKGVTNTGHRGPLHLYLERVFRVKHPGEWTICGSCGGDGKAKGSDQPCRTCLGAGYKITHEPLT